MTPENRKVYSLEGLACANCAAKMELGISKIDGVNSATVDFLSKKLTIGVSSEVRNQEQMDDIISKAENIVNRIEADVKMVKMEETHGNKENLNSKDSHDHDHEGNDIKKRVVKIGISVILLGILMFFSFEPWLELVLYLLIYVIIGGEVLLSALKNIIRGQIFDENFLMSIATIGAFIIGEFAEGVAVMLFYNVGELFQDLAVDRSRKSINELMDIRPDYANILIDGESKKISPYDVKIGDSILVRPGEKVPLDGIVKQGNSMVDTSALTGESLPREVEAGSNILSGSINENGVLTIEVTKEFGESTVSKILELVENASAKKAPTEKFITKFARYYTPVVVIVAALIAVVPPLVLPNAIFYDWLYRALIFLVISCPCALVISIPLGFFGGIGAASKNGILIKGGNYLEALNKVELVVFDKTGTLTKGVFKVTQIKPEEGYSNKELLKYAAYGESYSNHPIAISILKAFNNEVDKSQIESYEELSGHGTKILLNGKEILVGNSRLMVQEGVEFKGSGSFGTIVYVAVDKQYMGSILISDEVKEDSAFAIKGLKKLGVKKAIMLTGDMKQVGEKIGEELGLDQVYAELLPNEKVEIFEKIEKEKSEKGKVIFVGDGINDAPVLARADIGMAMGGLGSDAAIEAADIIIMTDEPSKIILAIEIAKRTNIIVWQNIIFALGVKLIFLGLGAFGHASMWEAVFADVGVSVIAILNSMRVLKGKE